MKNRPAYGIDSVDHALRLAVLLQQEGPLRVIDAAERLGVARSTAHRLLAMLVYRDFAEQAADRRYGAGPVLRQPAEARSVPGLRELALPHLRRLVERCGETVNLMQPAGAEVRFVATVECDKVLRVGDREGKRLPAHLTSGGRALLAELPAADVERICATVDPAVLRRDLRKVRRQGFAVNDQQTEAGVTAIGRALHGPGGARAAVSIAMPTARYDRTRLPEWVALLAAAVGAIEADVSGG